jgi:hypothetical protein
MSKNNIDQALAALSDTLKGIELGNSIDYKEISKKLPFRSLTGDHINGGTITNFASSGIIDTALKPQLTINDQGVHVSSLTIDRIENLTVSNLLKVKILEVDEIRADIKFEKNTPITFSGDTIDGKGLLWVGKTGTKQLIFASKPDRFFSSEDIDLAKGKSILTNGIRLFTDNELGPTITKSNLKQVGRLNGLIVDGDVSIGQYLNFSNVTNRLGLGTEEPNAAVSIVEDGVEVVIGTSDFSKGIIGTYASHQFDIVTDNTSRISIGTGGDIVLGNPLTGPIKLSVLGAMNINVNSPDHRVDLQVRGAIKFNNNVHLSGDSYPLDGLFSNGDIVWNTAPQPGKFVGWVCTKSGNPGLWSGFGRIE